MSKQVCVCVCARSISKSLFGVTSVSRERALCNPDSSSILMCNVIMEASMCETSPEVALEKEWIDRYYSVLLRVFSVTNMVNFS